MNKYIPLPNLVFLSPYSYLQTKFYGPRVWAINQQEKTRNGNLHVQYGLRKTRSVRYY